MNSACCLWALVASELALEAKVGVAAAAPPVLLLRSDQFPRLSEFAS
jgi:hypothetical protein